MDSFAVRFLCYNIFRWSEFVLQIDSFDRLFHWCLNSWCLVIKSCDYVIGIYRTVVCRAQLSRQAKLALFKSLYYPTLTYGHESWVLTDRMRSRVQAAEMRYLRRVAGVRRIDKVRNSTIREELNIEPLLLKVERSQLRWFGHVLRMTQSRLVHQVYSALPTGNRPRGRPRARW